MDAWDLFAAAALQSYRGAPEGFAERIAKIADAMMAERAKRQPPPAEALPEGWRVRKAVRGKAKVWDNGGWNVFLPGAKMRRGLPTMLAAIAEAEAMLKEAGNAD